MVLDWQNWICDTQRYPFCKYTIKLPRFTLIPAKDRAVQKYTTLLPFPSFIVYPTVYFTVNWHLAFLPPPSIPHGPTPPSPAAAPVPATSHAPGLTPSRLATPLPCGLSFLPKLGARRAASGRVRERWCTAAGRCARETARLARRWPPMASSGGGPIRQRRKPPRAFLLPRLVVHYTRTHLATRASHAAPVQELGIAACAIAA